MNDPVNSPSHYTDVVPGIECIEVTRHFNFARGNAIKYVWRAGMKGDAIQDLRKAIYYIEDEITRLQLERRKASVPVQPRIIVDDDHIIVDDADR
jgi:hypothetical protein